MVSKDQLIGWVILIVCIIVVVGYPLALYLVDEATKFLIVAIPVTLAMILVFGIGAWIGWTMATTPPPKPIEEIEAETEKEEEAAPETKEEEKEEKEEG